MTRTLLLLALLCACTSDKTAGDDSGGGEGGSGGSGGGSGSSGGGSGGGSGSGGDTGDSGAVDADRYFPDGAVWYQDVSGETPDPQSDDIIATLQAHGWGLGRFQIDFSIEVLEADASTEKFEFTPTDGEFWTPDCDHEPVPLPEGGRIEGESGYACESDGDCHLIVVQRDALTLYEMWRANVVGDTFYGGCMAVWDMSKVYGPEGRGLHCTSADAAGYPIAPLLFTADEVASGEIRHAIRFILPNEIIRSDVFVAPATHTTSRCEGGPTAPPYGVHLRLRADYPLEDLPNEASRTVARALQTYGMFLADGGNVALTAQADTFSTAKWADLMESRDLEDIEPQDFEVMPMDTPVEYTGTCARAD